MEGWGKDTNCFLKQNNLSGSLADSQINDTQGRAKVPKGYTTDARQLEIRNSDARDERELQQCITGLMWR